MAIPSSNSESVTHSVKYSVIEFLLSGDKFFDFSIYFNLYCTISILFLNFHFGCLLFPYLLIWQGTGSHISFEEKDLHETFPE
jgi:hypothetical protein